MRLCLLGLLMAASVTANAAVQTQEIPTPLPTAPR